MIKIRLYALSLVMLGEASANTTVVCGSSATVMDLGKDNTVLWA